VALVVSPDPLLSAPSTSSADLIHIPWPFSMPGKVRRLGGGAAPELTAEGHTQSSYQLFRPNIGAVKINK